LRQRSSVPWSRGTPIKGSSNSRVQLKFNKHHAEYVAMVTESQVPLFATGAHSSAHSVPGQNTMLTSRSKRESLRQLASLSTALALVLILDACVSTTGRAPGSHTVQLTTDPSDVSTCTAVGDIKVPGSAPNKDIQFRKQAVGLGADTALVTVSIFGDATPVDGIAYRCPHQSG
jgi:hypothetical protein